MIFLLDKEEIIKTFRVLTTPYNSKNGKIDYNNLKISYNKFLKEMYPDVPYSDKNEPEYITNSSLNKNLIKIFSIESSIDDTFYDLSENFSPKTVEILNRMKESADKLGELCPEFHLFYNLSFNSIFHSDSKIASGGTTSSAVGILFIDPRDYWIEEDYYEFLIHELGHTVLFLQEWRFGLFSSQLRLKDSNTFALSAIRGELRPMDKAFHSALVATDVLLFREKVIGHNHNFTLHPNTNKLISMVNSSFESMLEVNKKENILTKHALLLISRSQNKLQCVFQRS